MGRFAFRSTLAAALLTLVGCDYDYGAGISGVVFADRDLSQYGSIVILRAVPDRKEGFSPTDPYLGKRVLEATCPLDHTDFPLEYYLFGDNRAVIGSAKRWVVLAWVAESEDETWVSPGTLYGTKSFEWGDRETNGSSWTDGVMIDMNTEYPLAGGGDTGTPARAGD